MTERISLVEAYNNRDVIAQLVRLRDNVDELMNILKDIDPNGDLTNVVTKTGDQTIDGVKTFIGEIVANCDIIQNGAAYETHAEQVFSVNDYIVTRDGQITGLAPGDLSGFHVKKYNGVDDSRLGVDNTGTMRVGDVGSEEPLLTRDEVANMTSGDLLKWDGVNLKAITTGNPLDYQYNEKTGIAVNTAGTSFTTCSLTLQPGRYLIIVRIDFGNGNYADTNGVLTFGINYGVDDYFQSIFPKGAGQMRVSGSMVYEFNNVTTVYPISFFVGGGPSTGNEHVFIQAIKI